MWPPVTAPREAQYESCSRDGRPGTGTFGYHPSDHNTTRIETIMDPILGLQAEILQTVRNWHTKYSGKLHNFSLYNE